MFCKPFHHLFTLFSNFFAIIRNPFTYFTIFFRPADSIAEDIRGGNSKAFDPDALKGFLKILPDTTTVCHMFFIIFRIK
jgi:hypothetical protein